MIKLIKSPQLFPEIQRLLVDCPRISILTAFLSNDAVNRIFNGSSCKIEIITSLYQEYVEPAGLETLKSLNAQIYIYSGHEFFHPKVYYFHCKNPIVIMGSSNFTSGGLDRNIELNILSDDLTLVNNLSEYIENLKASQQVGLLTFEALQKYKDLHNQKIKHLQDHFFQPPDNDLFDIYRLINFEQIPKVDSNKIVKIKAANSSSRTREIWGVVVANKAKNVISGTPWEFFPAKFQHFQIQCQLSGHKIVSFESYLTEANHISGLMHNLEINELRVMPDDIFCFEELQHKKVYRFWIESA